MECQLGPEIFWNSVHLVTVFTVFTFLSLQKGHGPTYVRTIRMVDQFSWDQLE